MGRRHRRSPRQLAPLASASFHGSAGRARRHRSSARVLRVAALHGSCGADTAEVRNGRREAMWRGGLDGCMPVLVADSMVVGGLGRRSGGNRRRRHGRRLRSRGEREWGD
ncbi:hypothetical protein GUJ93_ZPchr0003g17222 [Zizania palustris]|uniref:Uncharacterized protein n=1 Tax=Zizania palustris TaxID=103762 RepID=A0A8J5SDY1_ZIZPA|nr:hypothetical protein GUJ93_ZPchr0003g17222 [Zizania palustris]